MSDITSLLGEEGETCQRAFHPTEPVTDTSISNSRKQITTTTLNYYIL